MDRYIRHHIDDPDSPVMADEDQGGTDAALDGIALCLSGGGYRAMLFHLGSLWRLNELGYLRKLAQVSSVSGGAIIAGLLGHVWDRLVFDPGTGVASHKTFVRELVEPIRRLAGTTLDWSAIAAGALLPTVTASSWIEAAYDKHLFGGATLEQLPAERDRDGRRVAPCFLINATNVQTGALWRFSREYMGDWRVGKVTSRRDLRLARAVAASAAFPPFLSPLKLKLAPSDFVPGSGHDLQKEPYTTNVLLTDGGVYDNLALETAFKRFGTLLVSNGGQALEAMPSPSGAWLRHGIRVALVLMSQVGALRKRQLIASYQRNGGRAGAYWGVSSDVRSYKGLADPIRVITQEAAMELAATPTRLGAISDERQIALIDWGYAICDTAMRRWVVPGAPRPTALPSGRSTAGP